MKKCCMNCFNDWRIENYLEKNGFIDNCDFCKQSNEKCLYLDNEIFAEIFSLLKKIYIEHQDINSKTLYSIINEWNLFSDYTMDDILLNHLCKIHGMKYNGFYTFNSKFNHLINDWTEYKNTVKQKYRFINSLPIKIEKLLLNPHPQFSRLFHEENTLFRERIESEDNNGKSIPDQANRQEMGMPPIDKIRAGRANPTGIPYLYLASSEETAIAEVRPWCGALITIGTFNLIQSISTINLSVFNNKILSDYMNCKNLEEAISELQFFNTLSYEMSLPISPNDSYLEYIPTQYVSEFFIFVGYDGLIFDSSLGPAQNVVLFTQDKIEVTSTELIEIEQIHYLCSEPF